MGGEGCGEGEEQFRQFKQTEMIEMFEQLRKQKIEVIDFREFMQGNYRKSPRRSIDTSLYSFMPSVTLGSFFGPEVAGLYGVVFGVFALGMVSHLLETYAANTGHEGLAEAIETITRLAFSIGGFSFIGYFLLSL